MVGARACEWCGWHADKCDAVHIVDEGPEDASNAIALCPNCHRIFDDVVRPRFHKALAAYVTKHGALPPSWEQSNKIRRKV
jgi:hypothetical protein